MARPQNKTDLLTASETTFQALKTLINEMPKNFQTGPFPFEDRDKNVRDVLIHLHEWHNMFLKWYEVGMRGEKPIIPAEGYTFKTTPELNQAIWEKYQATDLSAAENLLQESHNQVMAIIQKHTNEELFTKKYYKWTNTTSLGSYLVSATSSHYDWALKKIRKYLREMKKQGKS